MATEIWVALIGLGGVVYASTVGLFARHIRKANQEHQERLLEAADLADRKARAKERQVFHDSVTSPFYPVKDWTKFTNSVRDLCDSTEIDRVLVLVAVNGSEAPKHASVVWEYRTTGESFSYVDVPLDNDYCCKLLEIKKSGQIRFKTEEAKNTLIGRYYETEGVFESIWSMIGVRYSHITDQVAYKYMSVATHDPSGFQNPSEIERQVDNLVAQFRGMLHVSGFGPL